MEDSVSNIYEKTQKALTNPKAKNENNEKILEKIVDEMKVYDSNMKR